MRKMILLLLLMTGTAFAQTTQTYTGVIKDLSNNVVTSGQVNFTLAPPTDSTIPGTGRFTPTTISCNINADGTLSGYVSGVVSGACIVASNTSLSPSGTSYRICIQPYYATPGSCFYDYALGGTKDISVIAPTLSTGPINYGGVPGPQGPVGPAGSTTANGSTGGFDVPGNLTALTINAVVYARPTDTLATMESRCPGSGHCLIVVTVPETFTLTSSHTTPANIAYRFDNGGLWTVNGAFTLTFGSGLVDGPQSTQIFAGSSAIAGLNYARPEWFGAPSSSASLLAAYNAVVADGTIYFLPVAYVSPFNTAHGSNVVAKNVRFEGSYLGQLDSATAPTQYASGTILQGEVGVQTGITLENLAIDNGSAFNTTGCGSPAPDYGEGLFVARNHAISGFITGVHIHHVGVLTCGTHADGRHTVLLENVYGADVNDLTATTTGGDYGIIIKSQYGSFSNLHIKGATTASIYCKSDYAVFQDGNCQNNRIDGYWVDDLATVGDTVGPLIDSQSDNVFGNTWMNGHFNGLGLGFRFIGGTPNTTSAEKIIGLTGINMQNACIYTNVNALVSNLQISGVSCEVNNSGGTGITFNTGTSLVSLSNITISSSASSTIDGIDDQSNSGSVSVNGATCFGFTGHCTITTNSASTPMLATNITVVSPVAASNGQIFEQHNNPVKINADMYWAATNWRCQTAPCTLWSVRDGSNNVQFSLKDNGVLLFAGGMSGQTVNTDLDGQLTLSGGAAVYTFAKTYALSPICTASDATALNPVKATTSTTTLTIAGTGSDVINYICMGRT